MLILQGFDDPYFIDHVLHLKKAPSDCYEKFSMYLHNKGY